jgi:hypothetical protein
MANHMRKAPHTFLSDTTGHSNPGPAPQDEPHSLPLMRQPWFIFTVLLTVLFIGTSTFLFFIWGLPILIDVVTAAGNSTA